MTVMGIMMNPTLARAIAPVVRFAVFDSLGNAEECFAAASPPLIVVAVGVVTACVVTSPLDDNTLDWATYCLNPLRLEKYKADPTPVRSAEGNVPRHNCLNGFGPLAISRTVPVKEFERDCCTRVLRRSAGWSSTAERMPDPRPAAKWKAVATNVRHMSVKVNLCVCPEESATSINRKVVVGNIGLLVDDDRCDR
jgi:hypothetical protein